MSQLPDTAAADPTGNAGARAYALVLWTCLCTVTYLDRDLFVLLLEPIKADLHLSDTQLGSLTGIAFGLFYSVLGVPLARWADAGNRITLAALAITLWGITAALYPWVAGFWPLWALRVAAGIGEAGCLPTVYSLLGDCFHRAEERTRATTFLWLSGPVAALISFGPGAYAAQAWGWRGVYCALGVAAVALAALTRASLVDPRPAARDQQPRTPMRQQVKAVWARRAARHLIMAIVISFGVGQGLSPWYATFLMRVHGMSVKEVGVWFAVIFGVGGFAGTYAGGYVAERFFHDDERAQLRLGAVFLGALLPCFLLFLFLPGKLPCLIALLPIATVATVFLGPSFAILLRLVAPDARATLLATAMLMANLLGVGLVPFLIGVGSDALGARFGGEGLRYSMASAAPLCLVAAFYLWRAGGDIWVEAQGAAHFRPTTL